MDPKEKYEELRTKQSLTVGKNLDTQVSLEGSADVLISEDVARGVEVRAGVADELSELSVEFPKDSPESAVIERMITEARLVVAAAAQVTGEVDNSHEIAEYEQELFDYYSPELFYAAAAQRLKSLESLSLPPDLEPARALVAEKLAKYVDMGEGASMERPNQETLTQVGEWLKSQFGDLFDELDEDGIDKYNAPQIVKVFKSAINSTPSLREQGWVAEEVVREKNAISTFSSKHQIAVSAQRVTTKASLKGLVVHEVFGHALRSAIAEESEIPVADQGTATYARFEESFLIALEQCLAGEYNPKRGVDHYLAVGLSVTGGESKDDIALLFESMHMLDRAQSGIDDAVKAAALRLTSAQVRRTFVGMTDVDNGIAHRKDIDYLHGLNDSWRLLNFATEKGEIDVVMRWLLSAKFNPFTKADRELVATKVAMPQVLNEFFEGES